MTLGDTVFLACDSLLRHRVRTSLTMLGMVIGVAAVVALMALGAGARAGILSSFDQLGSNMLILSHGSGKQSGRMIGAASLPTLTWGDLTAIRREIPNIEVAVCAAQRSVQVVGDGINWGTIAVGAEPGYTTVRGWTLAAGRDLTTEDQTRASRVVLLGNSVATHLGIMPEAAIGMQLRVDGHPWRIVGVLASKGKAGGGQDQDDVVVAPLSTYRRAIAGTDLGSYLPGAVYLRLAPLAIAELVSADITSLLRQRHRLAEGAHDDFALANLGDIASAVGQVTGTLTWLLGSVAGISLVVGGLGVMNVMLIAVGERTREIGLRVAVGATPGDIRRQFLIEAVLLAGCGGIFGWLIGSLAAWLGTWAMGWKLILDPWVVAVALGTAVIVGLAAGFYPAVRASRLDPLIALRTE